MKKLWIPVVAALVGLGLGATLLSLEPLSAYAGGMGMMGSGMMGSGMMSGGQWQGQDMPGECEEMMDGYGYPGYYGAPEGWKQQTGETLSQENAVSIVQNYLSAVGNPNLAVGKVEKQEDGNYLVEILTKEGSLVDRIVVDGKTGRFTSIYREGLD